MYSRCATPVFTEPGARGGRRPRSQTPQEALDGPRRPAEIERNQVLARCRVNDLQRIFTSRHANECSSLRQLLLSIEDEAVNLRRKIAELEQEQKTILHGANEKEKEEKERAEKEAADKAESEAENVDLPVDHQYTIEKFSSNHGDGSLAAGSQMSMPAGGGSRLLKRPEQPEQPMRKHSQAKRQGMILTEDERKNHQELLVQQLEQTAKQQEQLIEELENEFATIQFQKEKQDKWIAKLEGEVLDTEITKVRYRVRLQSATDRGCALSELLKSSYEKMSVLLKDRVSSEEESAKNDAILQYLQVVFNNNAQEFQDNRIELKSLMSRCGQNKDLKERVKVFDERLRKEHNIADQLVQKTDELSRKLDAVQAFWMTIPAEVKSAVHLQEEAAAFKAKRTTVHPLNAIRSIKEGVSHLNAKQQIVLRMCNELLESSPIIQEHDGQATMKPVGSALESHPFEVQN
eukprot:gnl/MRDRNA2_/MRDRNA2_29555_c0_seq1.p1 gnl/MRDRNA2_/MRDRNA2_29555_c0~~gnl/MRDRNA2_/MRDRNA2_29555_c0_seq1.p1  ORF type:complete len:462 (-),score=114.17 gnl/MRDRNA2_/MRDRNA2_29555_c0_seq1:65-1450(-)